MINEKGEVEGEGSITYDLEQNTSGLDDLVASVHSLMSLAKVPSMGIKNPFLKKPMDDRKDSALGSAAEDVGKSATDVKGVTKIQYNAPHLKNGPEIRHFKFKGRAQKGTIKEENGRESSAVLLEIDEVLNFTLYGGETGQYVDR